MPMDDGTATATLDQGDEEILAYAISDEALEAAAGTRRAQTDSTVCRTAFVCYASIGSHCGC
jgi:hypothetical protein